MRGQGLPLQTIVIAALVVIVLIVLAVMIVQRTTIFGRQLRNVSEQSCEAAGGHPEPMGSSCEVIYGSFPNLPPGMICCRAVEAPPEPPAVEP